MCDESSRQAAKRDAAVVAPTSQRRSNDGGVCLKRSVGYRRGYSSFFVVLFLGVVVAAGLFAARLRAGLGAGGSWDAWEKVERTSLSASSQSSNSRPGW